MLDPYSEQPPAASCLWVLDASQKKYVYALSISYCAVFPMLLSLSLSPLFSPVGVDLDELSVLLECIRVNLSLDDMIIML